MATKHFLPLIVLILWFSHPLYAQKDYLSGYVITKDGDTLYGTVRDRKLSTVTKLYTKVRFKNQKGKKRKFGPDDIAGYKRGESIFQSTPFEDVGKFIREVRVNSGEKHFLRIWESGYLTLYEHEFIDDDCDSDSGFRLYLKKADENQFTHVPMIGFRKKMKFYFSDHYPIIRKIENKTYRYRNISRLVKDYNSWVEGKVL